MLDDKYRIDHLIAVGGMGAVYAGTHIKLRKRVAIKVLNPQLSSAPMIERFHREAITASQIGHEGIAQVTDLGTSQAGEPFLVMELLEGEPLAARLRSSGPLSIEDACELACSILSPLAAAHRAGIVHRDLKPDNVFLVRQSRGEMVKLLDFGISRASGLESEFRLTTTGLVLGTPYYMSPEQARGDHEVTPAADLYAIGVILYEMLIGTVPIQADNYNQLMYRVMMGEYARPRERRPDLPEMLEQLILQAMAQEPTQRPISATDLEQSLLAFCRPTFRDRLSGQVSGRMSVPSMSMFGTGSGAAAPTSPPTGQRVSPGAAPTVALGIASHPAPRRRAKLPWIVAGVLVLAGGGAAFFVAGQREAPAPVPAPPTPVALPHVAPVPPTSPGTLERPDEISPIPPPPPPGLIITIKFTVDAPNPTITVDGVDVKNGEITVPIDERRHPLHITAPGRVAHDEALRYDENQRLSIQLPRAGATRGPTPTKPRTHDVITSESPY